MLVKPGPGYPPLGGVVDGTRLPARGVVTQGITQFYANSRGTIRFLRVNAFARNVGLIWQAVPPLAQQKWRKAAGDTVHWRAVTCYPARDDYYVPPGVPEIATNAYCHSAYTGVEPNWTDGPDYSVQPAADAVQILQTGPLDPLHTGGPAVMSAVWNRSAVPPAVPCLLLVYVRMVYSLPDGVPAYQKFRFGGVVPIRYGEPVALDAVLLASARVFVGATMLVQCEIMEPGFIPFFLGIVAVNNRADAPASVGWGLQPWGEFPWGQTPPAPTGWGSEYWGAGPWGA